MATTKSRAWNARATFAALGQLSTGLPAKLTNALIGYGRPDRIASGSVTAPSLQANRLKPRRSFGSDSRSEMSRIGTGGVNTIPPAVSTLPVTTLRASIARQIGR